MCPHGVDLGAVSCLECERNPDPYDQIYAKRNAERELEAKKKRSKRRIARAMKALEEEGVIGVCKHCGGACYVLHHNGRDEVPCHVCGGTGKGVNMPV
jgi:hypothetical protein